MQDWLETTGSIPDDPELEMDLTGPEYFFSAKNQIQLEKKEDMKKRGLASPDCGDMLAMSFAIQPTGITRDEALAERIAKVQGIRSNGKRTSCGWQRWNSGTKPKVFAVLGVEDVRDVPRRRASR